LIAFGKLMDIDGRCMNWALRWASLNRKLAKPYGSSFNRKIRGSEPCVNSRWLPGFLWKNWLPIPLRCSLPACNRPRIGHADDIGPWLKGIAMYYPPPPIRPPRLNDDDSPPPRKTPSGRLIPLIFFCGFVFLAVGGALMPREAMRKQNDGEQKADAKAIEDVPQIGIVLEDFNTDAAAARQKYGERHTVKVPIVAVEMLDGQYVARSSLGLFGGVKLRLHFDEREGKKLAGRADRADGWSVVRGIVSSASSHGIVMLECELLD
jgi:hypothetical protein